VTCQVVQATDLPLEPVERGAYLARAADCTACHSAPEGKPFAGGVALHTPIGTIYTTNITPDPETGIGRYSKDDFVKALREGVAKDGHHLYPAMPYASYAWVSQEDLSALYIYFMQGVRPVRLLNHSTKLSWPLSQRSLMAIWKALYLKKGAYAVDPDKSAAWNRGAYLVQGLGHCGECHTPRGVAGQMKAMNEGDGYYLAGATLDYWHASPLTGDSVTGLAAWSREEISGFLKSGRTDRVAALGPMSEVVEKSSQYLTDQDLMAIAEYLKSLPAFIPKGPGTGEKGSDASDTSEATRAFRLGATMLRGSLSYLDNCNACHRSDGSGAKRTFPALDKNEAVNAQDPVSLIRLVLAGSAMPSTQAAPSALAMPGLGWRLSDEEVADLLSFVRSSWGNHAATVSPDKVARVRKALARQKRAM
jgi:mono/diheme cytochrome c family protein